MDELQHLDLVREFVQTAALAAVAQELECRRLLVDQLKVLLLAAHDTVEVGARVMGGGRRCRGQDQEQAKGQLVALHGDTPLAHCGAARASRIRDCRVSRSVAPRRIRSEEHTSELQSLMRLSYAVFCLKKKK